MRSTRLPFVITLLILTMACGSRQAVADVGNYRVSFGNRIYVGENQTVGDVLCFLCSVEAHGKIKGDIVTFLGGVKATSPISGDVVSFLGDINLTQDARVAGDLVVLGGSVHQGGTSRIGGDRVTLPLAILLIPILLVAAIVYGISGLFRRRVPIYYGPPAR